MALRTSFLIFIALIVLPGCLFHPGKEQLRRYLENRPEEPDYTFSYTQPSNISETGASISIFEQTLEFWNQPGSEGEPRWKDVLVPNSDDLYDKLLDICKRPNGEIHLKSYHYDSAGLDYLALVDYFDENGELIGFDYIPNDTTRYTPRESNFVGYENMAWWEYPMFILDVPVYLTIGIKELAGEIIKSPLSAIDLGWIGTPAEKRNPFSPVCFERAYYGFLQDWKDGFTGLTWRFRVRNRHTPWDLGRDLLGAVPIVGPIFDHKGPPERKDPPPKTKAFAISQGIHAGGDTEQYTRHLERAVKEHRPEVRTMAVPFPYGGLFDVMWSLLNVSNGMAYQTAHSVVFQHNLQRDEGLESIGFSGGVQRFGQASKLLRLGGFTVNKSIGVAGPFAGFSAAQEYHILLGDGFIEDPVVGTAHFVNFVYWWLPMNVTWYEVKGGGGHHLPYFPHPQTRQPESGYRVHVENLISNP